MAYLRRINGGNGVDQHSGDPDTIQYCSESIKRLRNTDSAEKNPVFFSKNIDLKQKTDYWNEKTNQ